MFCTWFVVWKIGVVFLCYFYLINRWKKNVYKFVSLWWILVLMSVIYWIFWQAVTEQVFLKYATPVIIQETYDMWYNWKQNWFYY
jgi:hypothetical protein